MIQVRNVQALSKIWCKPPQPPTLRPLSHTNTFPTNFQFDQNFICRSYQCRGFVSVHIEIHGSTSWECISHEHCIVRDGVSIIWEESLQLNYLIAKVHRGFSVEMEHWSEAIMIAPMENQLERNVQSSDGTLSLHAQIFEHTIHLKQNLKKAHAERCKLLRI